MKTGFERARELLREYSQLVGLTGDDRLEFDAEDSVEIAVGDDTIVNLAYRRATDTLVCWALVGELPDTVDEAEAMLHLLERGANAGEGLGYVVSLEPDSYRLVAHDFRPLVAFANREALGAWIQACLANVRGVRDRFGMTLPEVAYESDGDSFSTERR